MKNIFLLILSLFVIYHPLLCQCPPGGMKFQGPICDKPTNAGVKEVTCSSLVVKWNGSKDQTYIIEASYLDVTTSKITNIDESDIQIACNGSDHCTATIPVEEGTKVTWSVQAKCSNGIYSDTLQGKEVSIPYCDEHSGVIHLYPNPNTGSMTVEYLGSNSGAIQFTVYDMKGDIVFNKIETAEAGINALFKFDLNDLAPGIYLLEARNGDDVKKVKFMIE